VLLYEEINKARILVSMKDVVPCLLHSFTTRWVLNGVDFSTAKQLMSHKSPYKTKRYAHHCPDSRGSGVEILDQLCCRSLHTLLNLINKLLNNAK
jgi:hypothetical protein